MATATALACLALGACTVGPDYDRPQTTMAPGWVAPAPNDADAVKLTRWWSQLDDPILVDLQETAVAYSPTLEQAVARIEQARANLASSKADGLPTLNGSGSINRTGGEVRTGGDAGAGDQTQAQSDTGDLTGGLDASWEIDLFGKVRRGVQASRARIEARVNDWHDAHLSLIAEVADEYVQLRGCEKLVDIYSEQSNSQNETARLTRITANAGLTAPADARLTEAGAASVRASLTEQRSQCDLLIKSLVSLTGKTEADLRSLIAPRRAQLPSPEHFRVTSVPADLVRQRPDVASSERELAAASAEIGVATAELYPSLRLGGSISVGASIQQWSFGPTITLPIFDGGKARAGIRNAHASYDLQHGIWRESVRNAALEVEQALVRLNAARSREDDAGEAASGYQYFFRAKERLRQVGSANVLDLENARRNALDAQRNLVTLQTATVQYWIALYKALGGGWDEAESPDLELPQGAPREYGVTAAHQMTGETTT